MKKIILILMLIIIIILPVEAEELPDITNDIEIRTKWYKEKEIGKYHPKGDDLLGYMENPEKIKYSEYSTYSDAYCLLPEENNLIYKQRLYKYKYVSYTQYITLTNFEYSDNVFIFYQGNKQSYEVISNENNKVVLKLPLPVSTEYLLFFIDYEGTYNITLYFDEALSIIALSKDINREKVLIPDRTWLSDNTYYRTGTSSTNIINSNLITHIGTTDTCRYQKIYTYRYKIEKEYYDNEYHNYIEGYLPDMNEIKVYYKGKELIKTVEVPIEVPIYEKVIEYVTKYQKVEVPKEVIKTVEVPVEVIKTVEVCSKNEALQNSNCQSSTSDIICPPQIINQVVSIEKLKEIIKYPQIIYISLFSMIVTIVILIYLIIKKYVARK